MLDVDCVEVWSMNPRQVVDQGEVDELVVLLSGPGGQRDAVHAIRNPEKPGWYLVVDGKRRLLAIRQGKLQNRMIKAILHDFTDPIELFTLAVAQNESNAPLTDLDLALSCRNMLDAGHAEKAEDLTGAIRRDAGTISKLLTISKLPQPVLDVLLSKPKKFTLSFCYEVVCRVAAGGSTEAAVTLANQVKDMDLSLSKAKQLAEKLIRVTPARQRRTWDTHQFKNGEAQVGIMKTLGGQVKIEIKGLALDKIERIRDSLEEILG